jgi:hypothetical protein
LEQTAETDATTIRRRAWVRQLIANRPRLGDRAGRAYYDNLDDAYPAIRATFQGAVTAKPDLDLLLAGSTLTYYWYYRNRLVEGRSWMRAVAEAGLWAAAGDSPPPPVVIFRLALAGMELLTGDVQLAVRQLDSALPHLDDVPGDLLVDAGEVLISAVNSAWARNEYEVGKRLSVAMRAVAERSGDSVLRLFADEAECVSGLAGRPPFETAAQAETIYHRGVAAGNMLMQFHAAAACTIAAMITGDADAGMTWVNRVLPVHAYFGTGGGAAFLEALANLAVMAGDHERAVRLYGTAYAETRRLGMVWPITILSPDLLKRTQATVGDDVYSRLWDEGRQITYEEVVQESGFALVP